MTRIERYVRSPSVEEAQALKAELGQRSFYLAGGTDVLVFPPADAHTAIDITRLGFDQIVQRNGSIEIGATARLRDIERHPDITGIVGGALTEAIRETGPWLIRNQATLAGNLCNASPSADSAPMLLALDAELVLSDESSIPLDHFFLGPHRTALGDRLVAAVRVNPKERIGYFHKLSRSKSDVAQVNLALALRLENGVMRDVRIALGSVAPTPTRVRTAESMAEGSTLDPDRIAAIAAAAQGEISPIDDWRAGAAYRRHIAGVMVSRALTALSNSQAQPPMENAG